MEHYEHPTGARGTVADFCLGRLPRSGPGALSAEAVGKSGDESHIIMGGVTWVKPRNAHPDPKYGLGGYLLEGISVRGPWYECCDGSLLFGGAPFASVRKVSFWDHQLEEREIEKTGV